MLSANPETDIRPQGLSRIVIAVRPRCLRACLILVLATSPLLPAQSGLDWDEETRDRADRPGRVVSVATDSTWPPMEYVNRRRELVGFDIDLVREIGLRVGFRPRFITVPWDGIFAGLAAGQYDMIASSVTVLDERRRHMLFTRPYLNAAQYLVVPMDETGIDSLADLVGGEVGAQIGTTGARLIDATDGLTLRSYDDLGHAVEDLAMGRLDGVVADVAIVEHYVLANPRYRSTLRRLDRPYAVEQYALAIRPDLPGLHNEVHNALEEIRRDGTLRRLRDFWFPHTSVEIPDVP